MSTKEVLAIAMKLFAMWVLTHGFWQSITIPALLSAIERAGNQPIPGWIYVATLLVFVGFGFFIAFLLFKLANSVLNSDFRESEISISEQNQRFLLQLGGLYFLIKGLTFLPNKIAALLFTANNPDKEIQFYNFMPLFGDLLQIAIGAWLILHASWWAFIFKKFRGRAK